MFLTLLVTLICIFPIVLCVPIDNGVKGYPRVICGVHSVTIDIDTEKTFQGRVFVKGESDRKECIKSFVQSFPDYERPVKHGETVGMELGFGQCNMRRQRTLVPRGAEYSFVLVISFHSTFITKVDQAYRIRCFYMEAEKTISQQLEVSMLTTNALNEQFPMPQCRYHIRRGGRDGPPLRFARIGEPVYHVWECDSSAVSIYGMLVKSCFVDDGQGNKVELVDEKGCANDKHLIPELTYDTNALQTFTETHVFKYADKSSLYFACTITLCFKEEAGCEGITPPKCGTVPIFPIRSNQITLPATSIYRDIPLSIDDENNIDNFTNSEQEMGSNFTVNKKKREVPPKPKQLTLETDLVAQPFIVLPIDENIDSSSSDQKEQLDKFFTTESAGGDGHNQPQFKWFSSGGSKHLPSGPCVSPNGLSLFLAFIFLLLVFSASVTMLLVRSHAKLAKRKMNVF